MGTGGGGSPKELIDCLFTLFFVIFPTLNLMGSTVALVIRTLG